jgi:hypothetical protein
MHPQRSAMLARRTREVLDARAVVVVKAMQRLNKN